MSVRDTFSPRLRIWGRTILDQAPRYISLQAFSRVRQDCTRTSLIRQHRDAFQLRTRVEDDRTSQRKEVSIDIWWRRHSLALTAWRISGEKHRSRQIRGSLGGVRQGCQIPFRSRISRLYLFVRLLTKLMLALVFRGRWGLCLSK